MAIIVLSLDHFKLFDPVEFFGSFHLTLLLPSFAQLVDLNFVEHRVILLFVVALCGGSCCDCRLFSFASNAMRWVFVAGVPLAGKG